jgi:hypothetical protein
MLDRPDAATLLRAMADTLSEEVLPATRGAASHSVRVVANLCRILEREVRDAGEAGAAARRALADLLGHEGSLEELARELDARLERGGDDPDFEVRVRRVLLEDVRRRLAIDKPGYDA